MAWDLPQTIVSYEAAEDLSNDQYRFVVLTSAETVRRPDSATEWAEGILQNAPLAGENADVCVAGYSKVVGGEDLLINEEVKAEYVSASDAGKGLVPAGTATHRVRGKVIIPTAAEDELATVRLVDYLRVI